MKDYSCDYEFKQKRNAIHADLSYVKECLEINKGFEEATIKYLEKDKKYKTPGYRPFNDFFRDSMNHVIIIHLWNLIGIKGNNKHNLSAYLEDVKNNVDDYVMTYLQETIVEGFVDPIKEIEESIEAFEKYHVNLNSGENNVENGRFMMPMNKEAAGKWEKENIISYSEIEEVFTNLWKHFHAIDKTAIVKNYKIQPMAFDVMRFLIEKSVINK
jgi:hypothetical protein